MWKLKREREKISSQDRNAKKPLGHIPVKVPALRMELLSGWVDGRAAKTSSDQLSVQGPGVYSGGVQLTDKETYKSDYAT